MDDKTLKLKNKLIKFVRLQGVTLNTRTKARGNLGFFAGNRIDIRKNIPDEKFIEVLIHEFAHLIHKQIEPDMARTGGNLSTLFDLHCNDQSLSIIKSELLNVAFFIADTTIFEKLDAHKKAFQIKLLLFDRIIKEDYPNFLRSKPFKEFNKYIKHSDAKYLLKYDKVKLITPFLHREKFYSIQTMDIDFPTMPQAFKTYIKLCSVSRKAINIQKRKNKLKKYYEKPSELFARFVQAIYKDEQTVKKLAPSAYSRFQTLLEKNFYPKLKDILSATKDNND